MTPTSSTTGRRFTFSVAAWVAVGLSLRLGYVLLAERDRPLGGDPQYFHGLALMLRRHRGWNDPYLYGYMIDVRPTATHPPLYPLLLAGASFAHFTTVLAQRVFSCLVGTATVALVALAGRAYGGRRAGVIAAAIAAVYPGFWTNDANLQSESLLAAVIALVLLATHAVWTRPSARRAVALGAAVALAGLTRAEALLLVPLLVWPALLRGGEPLRRRVARAGAATLAVMVVVAPWVGWNLTRFDRPVFMSTNFGVTLFDTSCDRVWYGDYIGWWEFSPPCPHDIGPRAEPDESIRDLRLRKIAVHYIKDHLSRGPLVVGARVGRIWGVFNPRQTRFLDQRDERGMWPTWIAFAMYYPLMALALVGFVLLRRRRVQMLPFVALAVSVTITAALFYGAPRFRVPVDVGIVVLAAVALDHLWQSRRSRQSACDE